MNPFPDWQPHRPSPGLRQTLFNPQRAETTRPAVLRPSPPWVSASLVLAVSWTGTLLVWLHNGPADSGTYRPTAAADALALVAQNSIPVASFAFTNASLFPSTNASFSGPNPGRD